LWNGAAPAAGDAQEAYLGLGAVWVPQGLAPLCGFPAGSVLAGLLLKAGKGVMTMAKRVLGRGNAAGHCKMQTQRGH
jgi:hypothetical protein